MNLQSIATINNKKDTIPQSEVGKGLSKAIELLYTIDAPVRRGMEIVFSGCNY